MVKKNPTVLLMSPQISSHEQASSYCIRLRQHLIAYLYLNSTKLALAIRTLHIDDRINLIVAL